MDCPSATACNTGGPWSALAYLYPDEDRRLMACPDVLLCFRVLWGFLTREGMRAGEAMALTWTDNTARTFAELGLGDLTPLDQAIPELGERPNESAVAQEVGHKVGQPWPTPSPDAIESSSVAWSQLPDLNRRPAVYEGAAGEVVVGQGAGIEAGSRGNDVGCDAVDHGEVPEVYQTRGTKIRWSPALAEHLLMVALKGLADLVVTEFTDPLRRPGAPR